GAAAGVGNVARTGAHAANQKVTAGGHSLKERAAAAIAPAPQASGVSAGAGAGAASGSGSAAPDSEGAPVKQEQPAWAKRLHRRQQITQAATTAAHTLRGGDGGGSGSGPSLRDSDS